LKVSVSGTSLASRLMIYTFSPTGGWTSPISTTISARMPNQIDLSDADMPQKSSAITKG
jgi:hypothetical protein